MTASRLVARLMCHLGRHDPWCRGRRDHCRDHNVIPIRARFRSRWICVRCDHIFREVPPR